MINLYIQNGNKVYEPVVEGDIMLTTQRFGSPGTLTFNVVKDGDIAFNEGDQVILKVDNVNVFFGFVFVKKRDKEQIIKVTAYDQLRYLKNKDTYVYTNKTANQFVSLIAKDFNLNTGALENTGYRIPSRVEDNTSLFDMIQNALDLTLQNTGRMYVLYDDCLLYTSPSPRDRQKSRMPSSA